MQRSKAPTCLDQIGRTEPRGPGIVGSARLGTACKPSQLGLRRANSRYGLRLLTLSLLAPLAACAAQPSPSELIAAPASESATSTGPQSVSGNPMRPGLWEFTRAGGMAANNLGKHCVSATDLSDSRSRVNGYLKPEEKQQCRSWRITWQGSSANYDGVCDLRGAPVVVQGRITASGEYYSDEQQQARDESGFAQAVKDIINARRIGDCQS